jgi:hypothetical protein
MSLNENNVRRTLCNRTGHENTFFFNFQRAFDMDCSRPATRRQGPGRDRAAKALCGPRNPGLTAGIASQPHGRHSGLAPVECNRSPIENCAMVWCRRPGTMPGKGGWTTYGSLKAGRPAAAGNQAFATAFRTLTVILNR